MQQWSWRCTKGWPEVVGTYSLGLEARGMGGEADSQEEDAESLQQADLEWSLLWQAEAAYCISCKKLKKMIQWLGIPRPQQKTL